MTQNEALDLLKMGKNVYLTGQAGSGKTFLLNKYIRFLKQNKINAAVTASTGIAATHLGGSTIHSWSGIGIKDTITSQDLSRIAKNTHKRNMIRSAKVLVIDEISMLHSYRLDMINQVCKYIRKNQRPFGGLQVVLCGDLFQLPPIKEGNLSEISFAYKSQSWKELDLTICYLDEQHRQIDDSFLKLLNEIRSQEVSEYTFEKLSARLNTRLSSDFSATKLYTHNRDVDSENNYELEKIDSKAQTYAMVTSGKKEIVEVLKKGCLAPETLVLKKEAAVIFIKNNPAKGYINGTLGKVIDFNEDNYPIVKTISGKEIVASPTSWQLEEGESVIAQIGQIPLRLAWAITVHKSQGMSLDAAQIDLSRSFAHGMGYVALSRVKSLSGISLLGINQNALMVSDEIALFDTKLRKSSNQISNWLAKIEKKEILKKQEEFLAKVAGEEVRDTELTESFSHFFE